jgi:HD-GYP domain-containing protein (c-di-GMP phosphodiesterase class II)
MFQEIRMGKVPQINMIATLADEIIHSMSRNPGTFLALTQLKNKNEYNYQHSVAVCGLMIALGRQLNVEGDMLRNLGVAGLLHDVGNLLIPNKILNKPRSLTDEEFSIMKSHPQLGLNILKDIPGIDEVVLDVCLHHHERIDGLGYPGKLSGEALSLPARMCAVCEVYDSIISDRHYKSGMAPAIAIRKMTEWQEGHYDLKVFHAFIKSVGIYPPGTLVKLVSGRLAVVMDQTSKSLLTPIVKVFFSTRINAHVFPELIDLSRAPDSIESVESPAKWKFNVKAIMGI